MCERQGPSLRFLCMVAEFVTQTPNSSLELQAQVCTSEAT